MTVADTGPDLPAAVLWDMDGTLVDTEPYWMDCEFELAAAHGGQWSLDHARALLGSDLIASGRYIRHHAGVDLPPEQIIEILIDGVVERVSRHVPWRPGVRELLDALGEAGVPCALVTMSYRRFAEAVLASLPPGTFAVVVAGDEVTNGKPHPEPYLTAAARLDAEPARCLAVEDSPTGLDSAVAAGMPALGVENMVPLAPNPGYHVLDTLVGVTPVDLGRLVDRLRPVV
jgi:HAD superfamily hydrolase (TIGR01509 family)